MGYPGKNYKQYATPKRRFEKTRIEDEKRLIIEYGLRNKREVWKAQSVMRKYRTAARELVAMRSAGINPEEYEKKKNNSSTTFIATASLVKTPISTTSSP